MATESKIPLVKDCLQGTHREQRLLWPSGIIVSKVVGSFSNRLLYVFSQNHFGRDTNNKSNSNSKSESNLQNNMRVPGLLSQ